MSIDWPRSVRGECVAACGLALWVFQPPVMARGYPLETLCFVARSKNGSPL